MTNALGALLAEIEWDSTLDGPDGLRRRIDAIDRIEARLLGTRELAGDRDSSKQKRLRDRADALCARLEIANRQFYESIRDEIRRGATPDWLLGQLKACSRDVDGRVHEDGYDYLDVVTSGILELEEPAADIAALAPGMVFYQPTPARHVLDLVGRAALTEHDVLVDLGSGLGHVALLTSISTNARSIGIEREAAYVDTARRCAQALNLTKVTFTQQDARDADFSLGTLFYLYTPFTGAILRSVLDSLRREAVRREIRIGTYGPCSLVVADEPWLHVVGRLDARRPVLFRAVAGAAPEE